MDNKLISDGFLYFSSEDFKEKWKKYDGQCKKDYEALLRENGIEVPKRKKHFNLRS